MYLLFVVVYHLLQAELHRPMRYKTEVVRKYYIYKPTTPEKGQWRQKICYTLFMLLLDAVALFYDRSLDAHAESSEGERIGVRSDMISKQRGLSNHRASLAQER